MSDEGICSGGWLSEKFGQARYGLASQLVRERRKCMHRVELMVSTIGSK